MNRDQIYNALDPGLWVIQRSLWNTDYASSVITFSTANVSNCTYTSSAPVQTKGLNAGTDAPSTELPNFINNLRVGAAQRLFDMHCTAVIKQGRPGYVFNATN